jgi:hypothetical protein
MQANPVLTILAAWCVPGAGHAMVGQLRKAVVFLIVLTGMFVIGLQFGGQVFPFQIEEPLVFLGAAAQWAVAGPRLAVWLASAGVGDVTSVTYEAGNTFIIVAGLLNALVVLDALDQARGVKRR